MPVKMFLCGRVQYTKRTQIGRRRNKLRFSFNKRLKYSYYLMKNHRYGKVFFVSKNWAVVDHNTQTILPKRTKYVDLQVEEPHGLDPR
jgi:hypothetical protein